jgi:hypothetical protein
MLLGSPAIPVIITAVLLVISAALVILSRLFPSTTPKSSVKALRVPDPSSRETTTISRLLACPVPEGSLDPPQNPETAAKTSSAMLNTFFIDTPSTFVG